MKVTTLAASVLSLADIVEAQNQPLAFEVASVKLSPPSTWFPVSFALCYGIDTQLPVLPAGTPDHGVRAWSLPPKEIHADRHDFSRIPFDRTGHSPFLEEELSIRLEPSKVMVDVIVIDHAEKPDAN